MNCESYREQILEFLLSTEAPEEVLREQLESLRLHLASCHQCREFALQQRDAFALVPLTLEPTVLSDDFSERIIAKIRSEQGTIRHERMDESSRGLTPVYRLISYFVAASLLISVVGWQWYYLHKQQVVAEATRDATAEERIQTIDKAIADLNEMQQQFGESQIKFVSFIHPHRDNGTIDARAAWDSHTGQLHFFGIGMKRLPAGQTYAIWFKSRNEVSLQQTFQANEVGLVKVITPKRQSGDDPLEITITVEELPIGNAPSDQVWCRSRL